MRKLFVWVWQIMKNFFVLLKHREHKDVFPYVGIIRKLRDLKALWCQQRGTMNETVKFIKRLQYTFANIANLYGIRSCKNLWLCHLLRIEDDPHHAVFFINNLRLPRKHGKVNKLVPHYMLKSINSVTLHILML